MTAQMDDMLWFMFEQESGRKSGKSAERRRYGNWEELLVQDPAGEATGYSSLNPFHFRGRPPSRI